MQAHRASEDRSTTAAGILQTVSDGQARLKAVFWADDKEQIRPFEARHYDGTGFGLIEAHNADGFTSALEDYLAGNFDAIAPLRVAAGGTPFQRLVWDALRQVRAGATTTYGKLAASIGRFTAARAVGPANGSNPVSIVVPCHHVIAARGLLTRYAGGVEREAWLLSHEETLLL